MASTPHPLGRLSPLSRSIYMYKPESGASTTSSGPSPRLILLATWMGAKDVHIAKYLTPYRAAYPSSPIVVIRTELSDFLVPGRRAERARQLAGLIPVLREAFPQLGSGGVVPAPQQQDETDASSISSVSTSDIADSELSGVLVKPRPARPELLIHVWSNGGGSVLAHLRAVLKKAQVTLPRYSFVLDSTPGQFHYRSTYTAFALSFPPWLRRILSPFLHAMVAWFWLRQNISRVFGGPGGPLRTAAASHNTPLARASEVRRAYIYSDGDKLIHAADVEEHARDAEARGFNVRKENFGQSAHVAHMKADPERYWRVARETFEGGPVDSDEGYAVVDAAADSDADADAEAEAAARALDQASEATASAEEEYAAAQASADAAAAAYEESKAALAAEVAAATGEAEKVHEAEADAAADLETHRRSLDLDLEAAKASDDAEAAAAAVALEKAAAETASAEEAYAKAKAEAEAAAEAAKPKKGKKRGGKH